MLKEKDKAYNFSLLDKDNKEYNLSDFLGKKVVVYFYPKDNTPGCTRQACAFRNSYEQFINRDVVVIGISKDTQKAHEKFVSDHNLPFILLSDPEKDAINGFGVWQEKKMYGKVSFGVSRSTFIIDESGFVEKVFKKANPDTNAMDILNYLDKVTSM